MSDAGVEFFRRDSDYYYPDYSPRRTYDLHCPGCGRYAKCKRTYSEYNGWVSYMRVVTRCSKCGDIDEAWG